MKLSGPIVSCDACLFLDAVRVHPPCGRPLCRDCLDSHICLVPGHPRPFAVPELVRSMDSSVDRAEVEGMPRGRWYGHGHNMAICGPGQAMAILSREGSL